MTDFNRRPNESKLSARLKGLLGKDISIYIDDASEDQKRRLLMLLEGLWANDDSKLTARLKRLLRDRDILTYVDDASEDQKRKLLMLLEDLQASDRRRHPRKPCSIEVTLDGLYKEYVRNISTSGAFIETSVPFQFGKPITITFSPPNRRQPFNITGKVVRRIPEGIGVKFTTVPGKELQEMIESL